MAEKRVHDTVMLADRIVTFGVQTAADDVLRGWVADWRYAGAPRVDDLSAELVSTDDGWLVRLHV